MNCCTYECDQSHNCPARASVAPIKSSRPRYELQTENGGASVEHGLSITLECAEPEEIGKPWPAALLVMAVCAVAVAAAVTQLFVR